MPLTIAAISRVDAVVRLGELAHLVRDHGEAAALLAGARRLDGGVEREQVRLIGDLLDDAHDARDLPRLLAQALDDGGEVTRGRGDVLHLLGRATHHAVAFVGELARMARRTERAVRMLGRLVEVMIKPLEGIKPKGVAGATVSGEGDLVLVLELHELLGPVLAPAGQESAAA
jgi:hypothetical protein